MSRNKSRSLFAVCAFALSLIPACSSHHVDNPQADIPPLFQQTDVFTSRHDGYFAYRIPAIQTAPDGSLLAFAEARKHNLGDPGEKEQDIDLVLKRSTDQGQTWSAMKIIEDPGENWSAANPATLVDRDTGLVWLFYLRGRPGRNTYTARPGTDDSQIFARTSADCGQTWSDPIDLTAITRDMADPKWRCSVVGPGGAIQTGTGRLILPVWKFEPWGIFAVYSDDHGRTWHRSGQVPNAIGDECQLVQLADGRLLFDIRQQKGPRRLRSISTDNGETWSAPFSGESVTPVCCAIERFDADAVLWTGPKGPNRNNLVVRLTHIHGNVETFHWERSLYTGRAAYSDLTLLNDNTIGVLYERGDNRDYQFITFTRFNRQWLQAPESATAPAPQNNKPAQRTRALPSAKAVAPTSPSSLSPP